MTPTKWPLVRRRIRSRWERATLGTHQNHKLSPVKIRSQVPGTQKKKKKSSVHGKRSYCTCLRILVQCAIDSARQRGRLSQCSLNQWMIRHWAWGVWICLHWKVASWRVVRVLMQQQQCCSCLVSCEFNRTSTPLKITLILRWKHCELCLLKYIKLVNMGDLAPYSAAD